MLELDRETGAVIYPGTDFQDTISGNYVERYLVSILQEGIISQEKVLILSMMLPRILLFI